MFEIKHNERRAQVDSDKKKRYFNFAYSWGASIVVAGALFKILHWPGANIMLTIGMGIEVVMFFISAFDLPSSNPPWEEILSALRTSRGEGAIRGSNSPSQQTYNSYEQKGISLSQSVEHNMQGWEQLAERRDSLQRIEDSLASVSKSLLFFSQNFTPMGGEAVNDYTSQIDILNKNLSNLNAIYELQLRGISAQISTIDQINAKLNVIKGMYDHSSTNYCEESEKMVQLMASLNDVYARMLEAMKRPMNMSYR